MVVITGPPEVPRGDLDGMTALMFACATEDPAVSVDAKAEAVELLLTRSALPSEGVSDQLSRRTPIHRKHPEVEASETLASLPQQLLWFVM